MPPPLCSTALPWYQDIRPSRPEGAADADSIHAAFERQAGRTPDRAILVDESGHLTYAALRSAIDARAAALRELCQGRPGQPGVGVLLGNDAGKVITYFACLKAGLPYVPLPPHAGSLGAGAAACLPRRAGHPAAHRRGPAPLSRTWTGATPDRGRGGPAA